MQKHTDRQETGLVESVKDGIVSTIEGTGDVAGAMVEAVSRTVAKTIGGVGNIAGSIVGTTSEVARGTIQAVSEVGGDCPLTPLTPGALAPTATCSYSFQFHPLTSGGRSATFTVHTGAGDR